MNRVLGTVLTWIFKISLLVFLLVGVIIVVGQLFGALAGSGTFVLALADKLGTIAIIAAAVCALAAFLNSYLPKKK